MFDPKIKHVVVLDDNRRFFLHVWRYLSGLPGFGVGNVSARWLKKDLPDPLDPVDGMPMAVGGGMCFVWWVDAKGGDPLGTLTAVIQRIKDRGTDNDVVVSVLIDVGDRTYGGATLTKILSDLADKDLEGAIQLVSAYRAGTDPVGRRMTILPKTDKLLEDVRGKVWGGTPRGDVPDRGRVAHVLITGAGFEMGKKESGLGLPGTPALLSAMYEHLGGNSWGTIEPAEPRGFPVILPAGFDASSVTAEELRKAARVGGLDDYFNALVRLVRSGDKVDALKKELAIREAFREVLLGYDWGVMQQSIDAAELPWTAWISTNYTGFADRAIRAVAARARTRKKKPAPDWFIVSSAEQAQIVHNIQLERNLSNRADLAIPTALFKVHGDIGDVRTMALAGEDKNALSNLGVAVGSLYKIYAAAQQTLEGLVDGKDVVFHIVGHDMRDGILNGLLRGVRARAAGTTFVMVNPDPFGGADGGPLKRLQAEFPRRSGKGRDKIEAFVVYASDYMARLRAGWSEVNHGEPGRRLADLMGVGAAWRDKSLQERQREANTLVKNLYSEA